MPESLFSKRSLTLSKMNNYSAKLTLFWLTVVFSAQSCQSLSLHGKSKSLEQMALDALPNVTCFSRRLRAVFGPELQSNLHVVDNSGTMVPVSQDEYHCGVKKSREKNPHLSFSSRYDSCYARIEGSTVVILLVVQLAGEDRWFRVNISCPLIKSPVRKHHHRSTFSSVVLPGKCNTPKALRVHCGPQRVTTESCHRLGCCHDRRDSACYYRDSACSLDGHFVFSVKAADTDPPLDPSSLIVKDQPHCTPMITTADTAVFKLGIIDCGTKIKADKDAMTYAVEVEGLSANRSAFSLQVQCDYEESVLKRSAALRSMIAITNPPPVTALGSIRVQMRIATDASFTSFFPENEHPLQFPLRKTVYVEISIEQPWADPTLSLRVWDCFAYPASRHSVWTLLYDGCPNPMDNIQSSLLVGNHGKMMSHSPVRRFNVNTFAFLEPHTGHPSAEQIYFYCWVEICTEDIDCIQPCSITSEGERKRRQALSGPNQVQLVHVGPLVLGQNSTEPKESLCVKQNTSNIVHAHCYQPDPTTEPIVNYLDVCEEISTTSTASM